MKYKHFFLENYKGIKDRLIFDLELDSQVPHCIIGNNESGKTTLLKGIELIGRLTKGDTLENGNRNAIKPKGDYFSGIVKLGTKLTSKKDEIKEEKLLKYLENQLEDNIELELTFSYEFQNSAFINNETEIKFAGSLLTSQEDIKLLYDSIKLHSPDIIYYEDFKFSVPKIIRFLEKNKHAEDHTYLNSEENKSWQKIFNDILKGHDKKATSFEDDIVNWAQKSDHDPQIAQSRLRNMGKYLDTVLKEWVEKQDNGIERFEIVAKQSENENYKAFNDYEINIIAGQNSYEMNERSKGLQWSFCFHILTGIRKNRNNNGVIFLLDEPASNLHIKPQNQMLQHLKMLCDDSSAVIYSTHAPELIGTTDECYKNTFIAKNKATEFQETDIHLINLIDADRSSIDIEELEPILAKLAYEDVKRLGMEETKVNWDSIAQQFKENFKLSKIAQISTIFNFVLNTVPNLFKS